MNFQADWQKAMDQFFQNNVQHSPLQGYQNAGVCSINTDPKVLSDQVERLVGMKNWLGMQVQMLEQQIQMLTSQLNTVAAMQQMQAQWQSQFAQFGNQLVNTVGSQQVGHQSAQRSGTAQTNGFSTSAVSGADIAQQWIDNAQKQVGQLINGLQASDVAVNAADGVQNERSERSESSSPAKKAVNKKMPVAPKKPAQKTISKTSGRVLASSVKSNGVRQTKAPTFAKVKKPTESGRVSIQ